MWVILYISEPTFQQDLETHERYWQLAKKVLIMLKLMDALYILYTNDALQRLKYIDDKDHIVLQVDVHKMTCKQARQYINNIINLSDSPMRLAIIHGYNHGTAISDLVRTRLKNGRIMKRVIHENNRGVTYLDVS